MGGGIHVSLHVMGQLTSGSVFVFLAVCSQGCYNGECVSPDFCECQEGYSGPSCDRGKLALSQVILAD